MDTFTLNNGLIIPSIGFGTYKAGLDSIIKALEEGYRYFDTASFYGNESDIALALKISGIERNEIMIASKIWKSEMGYDGAMKAFSRTLEKLGTDYLDVLMIHWPRPDLQIEDWKALDVETWRAMEDLYSQKKVRALGLSNFLPYHAENIMTHCRVAPSISQIEFHVGHTQTFALEYFRKKSIQLQAWSPIGRGRMIDDELIIELAEKYHVSPVQLCLKFCLQEGVMPLPKASSRERMRENLSLNFMIDDEDIMRLENVPPMGWSGEHPDRVRVRV